MLVKQRESSALSKRNWRNEVAIHPEYNKRVFLDESEKVLITALYENAEFTAILGEGIGKESGLPYQCLDILLTSDCIKKVFLERAELALINLTN